jgi:hypothetical protein
MKVVFRTHWYASHMHRLTPNEDTPKENNQPLRTPYSPLPRRHPGFRHIRHSPFARPFVPAEPAPLKPLFSYEQVSNQIPKCLLV